MLPITARANMSSCMTDLNQLKNDLVAANRILADNNVPNSFGHVSIRHPDNPGRFLMARARAPMCVEIDDIMQFTLEGDIVGPAAGQALFGAVHPRRNPGGPSGRQVGRSQSQSERRSVLGCEKAMLLRDHAHGRAESAVTFRIGTFVTSSATAPICSSPTWRWRATLPNRSECARWR